MAGIHHGIANQIDPGPIFYFSDQAGHNQANDPATTKA